MDGLKGLIKKKKKITILQIFFFYKNNFFFPLFEDMPNGDWYSYGTFVRSF